jgi:3-oxoacyl-[acyl-carrier protein] reductase
MGTALEGKVAIVTGSGRGIGRAIALRFASEGADVVATARTQNEVTNVAAEIQRLGGKAVAAVADVSQEAGCEQIVRTAHEAFGAVHILVNNAGIYGPVLPVEKISLREWDEVIAVNLPRAASDVPTGFA